MQLLRVIHLSTFIWGIHFSLVLSSGRENVVRALVKLGAKIETENPSKNTPLHDAASHGKLFSVLELKSFDPY